MRNGPRAPQSKPDTQKRTSNAQLKNGATLREEIRHALLSVLRSEDAPATAKASAARTLADFFINEEEAAIERAPVGQLSVDDIDAELARLGTKQAG